MGQNLGGDACFCPLSYRSKKSVLFICNFSFIFQCCSSDCQFFYWAVVDGSAHFDVNELPYLPWVLCILEFFHPEIFCFLNFFLHSVCCSLKFSSTMRPFWQMCQDQLCFSPTTYLSSFLISVLHQNQLFLFFCSFCCLSGATSSLALSRLFVFEIPATVPQGLKCWESLKSLFLTSSSNCFMGFSLCICINIFIF